MSSGSVAVALSPCIPWPEEWHSEPLAASRLSRQSSDESPRPAGCKPKGSFAGVSNDQESHHIVVEQRMTNPRPEAFIRVTVPESEASDVLVRLLRLALRHLDAT